MQNKLLKLFFLICLAAVTSSGVLFAQQGRTITGTVVDEDNAALPGASIVVKGTTIGTASDLSGKFSLTVPEGATTLVITFVGMEIVEVPITSEPMMITMELSKMEVDAVVVVGYGTQRKSELTGASVSVSSEQLASAMTANLDQALQGRAAGVTAVYTSGQPGSAVSIRIRGQGSLRASASEPLYVIDGVPVQNVSQSSHDVGLGDRLGNGSVQAFSGLAGINPADILTMEILKDASATAIYGSRGANGVVLITTKGGKAGEAKFTYEGYYGIQQQIARLDVMDLRQFAQYSMDWAAETSGRDPRVEFQDPSILGPGTDWQNELYRTAPMQSHQLSASGGDEKIKYYVSGGYFTQDGTMVGTDFNRYSGRVNLDSDLKKWLKLGAKVMFSRTQEHLALNNSTEGIISVAMRTTPDVPVRNADGTWAGLLYEGAPSVINPIAKALDETNILKKNLLNANFYTDLTLFKGLTLRTEIGGELGASNAYHFTPTYQYGSLINNTNTVRKQNNQNFFWQLKNYLTYNTQLGNHNITAMVGQEVSESRWEYLSGTSSGLTSNDIQEPGLGDPTSMQIGSGHGSAAMASFFARANYSLSSKYYLTYTFRYDGSSNFGPKNRWAPFHAVSGSWRISQEPFMQGISEVMNDLKIRAGWGQTGNQNIGGYRWGAAIGKMPSNLGMGFRQTNIANPYITWEKQEQINVGLDMGFIQNRITLVVDMYLKTSTAMLMDMQLPSYMGTSGNVSIRLNPPMGNFGEIENRGIEISLNTRPVVGKFTWENDLQFTLNRNKLLGLTGTPAAHIEGYGQWTDLVSLTELGDPLYNFYGYQVAGIYQNEDDILTSPKPKAYPADGNFKRSTVWPGDLKFKDLSGPDGTPDGVIDEFDRTSIGSPLPKFSFGFNNIFSYSNFELSVYLNGSVGNKLMNYVGRTLTNMNTMWSNQLSSAVDRAQLVAIDPNKVYPFVNASGTTINNWFDDIDNVRVGNPGTTIPRAVAGDPNENARISDRYIEDGSYVRVKNVSLGYNLPRTLTRKASIDNMKVYVNVQNLLTFTKYSGLDPEVGASQTNDNVFGMDNGRYPAARVYTFGLNFTF
ncbi:MAG TPA: TonB-dependent receptor [Bacteroidales bacterium]|nr:TonB-dependent receptor [Bacteroidales bacterium]